jgi:hypothetical protein
MSETVPKRLRPSHGGGSSTVGVQRGHHKHGHGHGHGHSESGRKLKAASERGDSAFAGQSRRKRQTLLDGLEDGRQFKKFQSEENLPGRPVESGAAGVVGGNGTPTPSEKVSRWHRDIFLVSPNNTSHPHPRHCVCDQCMSEYSTYKFYNQILMERGGGGGEVTPHSAVPIKEEDELALKDAKSEDDPVSNIININHT